METVGNTLSILFLYVLWRIDLIYDRYFGKNESMSNSGLPKITMKDTAMEIKRRIPLQPLKNIPNRTLLKNVMTPAEEDMLKRSCAKGYSDGNGFSEKLRECADQTQIPRSTFTAMWIDSCVK